MAHRSTEIKELLKHVYDLHLISYLPTKQVCAPCNATYVLFPVFFKMVLYASISQSLYEVKMEKGSLPHEQRANYATPRTNKVLDTPGDPVHSLLTTTILLGADSSATNNRIIDEELEGALKAA